MNDLELMGKKQILRWLEDHDGNRLKTAFYMRGFLLESIETCLAMIAEALK